MAYEDEDLEDIVDPQKRGLPPAFMDAPPSAIPTAPPVQTTPSISASPGQQGAPPPVKPPGYADRYAALQAEKPQREDPKFAVPGWKKALGFAAATLGGTFNPRVNAGDLYHHVLAGPYEKALGDWSQKEAAIKQEAGLADTEAQMRERDAESLAKTNAPKLAASKEQAGLAEHGLERDASGNIVPIPQERLSALQRQKIEDAQKLDEYRRAQGSLAEAREELARAQNDPNSPQFKMALKKIQMAELAHDIAAQNLGLHREQFENRLQEQELIKPSGQTQSRGSAARSALDVVPHLEKLTKEQAEQMGPIVGRIARGEIAIGNVDPKVAELYGAMKSFYALQPAVHGFRNAEFVKDFETAIGTLERNPDAFLAGIKGLRPTLEAVEKEGKTSHKRIVEGRDNPPAPEPEKPKASGITIKRDANGRIIGVE